MSWTGIPWVDRGRTRAGCDCWGLVRMVYAEECAIELDDYSDISANDLLRVARAFDRGCAEPSWTKVDKPRRHDVVVMKHEHGSKPVHCGVMRDDKRMLSVWLSTESVIMPVRDLRVANNVLGFYRHRELA